MNGIRSGGQHGMLSYCRKCNLPYRKMKIGVNDDTGWISTKAKEENITVQIKLEKIQIIEVEIKKYKVAYENWKKFSQLIEKDDKLFFFEDDENELHGIVLIRKELPVLDYKIHKYLFEKLIKKHNI